MRALLALLALVALLALAVALWPPSPPRRPAPVPALPAPAPGDPLTLTLGEPAATHYAAVVDGTDPWARDTLNHLGLAHDLRLDHAARELARVYAALGSLLPGDALQFILDASGAAVWGVRQTVVVTGEPAPDAVADALRDQIGEVGVQAGVGRAPARDGRTVVALISGRAGLTLDPITRTPDAHRPYTLTGRLADGLSNPQAVALTPAGAFVTLPVTPREAEISVAWTPTPGRWIIELLADADHGPAPLAQLSFFVDTPAPTALTTRWPVDPDPVDADAAAALIAADRAAHDAPPLTRSEALDAVAAAHAADMRDQGFMGHVSPTTGGPADRVRAAGYRAAIVAENVAFNRSLADAQAGLMRSLGHRRNLLSDDCTAFGVGLAAGEDGWFVAQVFARPRPVVADAEDAERTLFGALGRAVGRAVTRSAALDALARAEARRPGATPRRVLDAAARAGLTGRLTAWGATLALLEQFEPPQALREDAFDAVGIGVHQHSRDAGPDIQVVMLLADEP